MRSVGRHCPAKHCVRNTEFSVLEIFQPIRTQELGIVHASLATLLTIVGISPDVAGGTPAIGGIGASGLGIFWAAIAGAMGFQTAAHGFIVPGFIAGWFITPAFATVGARIPVLLPDQFND